MWTAEKIELKRFISHLDSVYHFKNGCTQIIYGQNLDDDGQESNGSGKSAIIESIIFALTGDSFRKVKATDLIMNDEQSAEVIMYLNNSFLKKKMVIARTLDRKKSSSIRLFINDVEKTDLPNVNEYNKYIIDLIGISREDLMNYFVVSKDKYVSFFNSSDTKKKEIIARFSGSNVLDKADDFIEADLKPFDKKNEEYNKLISNIDVQIEAYNEQLEGIVSVDEQKKANKLKIDELTADKKEIPKKIQKLLDENKEFESSRDKIKKSIADIDITKHEKKISEINVSKSDFEKVIIETKKQIKEYDETISSINKNLLDVVECPKCNHEFSVKDADLDVAGLKDYLPILNQERTESSTELISLEKEVEGFEKLKKETKQLIDELKEKKSNGEFNIKEFDKKIEANKSSEKLLNQQLISINQNIATIKSIQIKDESATFKNKIKELEKQKADIGEKINENTAQKEEIQKWIINFKKFRTYLANKSIKSIESYTNHFLSKINTNLNIRIEGYKLISNNQLRETISIEVLRNGLFEGLFEKFSGGERMRIDICVILALQKLINLNAKSGGLDILLLDEIIESVDATGVSEILKQLNTVNQTIAIITHTNQNQINDFENKVIITKKNKISTIE